MSTALAIIAQVKRYQAIQANRRTAEAKAKALRNRTDVVVPQEQLQAEAERLDFAAYRNDPVGFCERVLGLTVWERQREILEAVRDHGKVAVRSGHKVGKTTSSVAIALWFACTRARALVIVTATKYEQVKNQFWAELRRVVSEAPAREDILSQVLGERVNLDPGTGLRFVDGRSIVGLASETGEGIAGYSSPELLFIVDEASGVEKRIFDAIEGNRAGGARMVCFGNPTRADGVFFDAFHEKSEFWRTIHVSSEETPNATGVGVPIPGLATADYIAEKRRELGEDNPEYQIRVAGNFATQAASSVVGLASVESAEKRRKTAQPSEAHRLEIGVDVARFGDDDSVIAPRRGPYAYPPTVVHGLDTVQVAGKVLDVARELRRKDPTAPTRIVEKVRVKVDVIGVGGGVADMLRQHKDEVELVEVNVAEKATAEDDYSNLRSQLWFAVATWLAEGGTYEPDPKLRAELLAAQYAYDTRGRRKVEPKDEIKKRLGRSPDRADALALAVFSPRGAPTVHATAPAATFDEAGIF